jgi:hypothetical protein
MKYMTAKPLARFLQCGSDILQNAVRVTCSLVYSVNMGVNIATGYKDATAESTCRYVYMLPN